jgi:hypothetical protein
MLVPALLLALCGCPAAALAAPMDVQLGFSSLPSAQGWTYVATGSHAGVLESSVFSVGGGVLFQNTMGQSNGVSGGGLFYQIAGGVTTTETKQIIVRARCLEAQSSAGAPSGEGGFYFFFAHGSVQYGFGLTPTRIFKLQSSTVLIPGTYDNTQFHNYVFDWSPPGNFTLYRDGVPIHTGSGGFSLAVNRIAFGDGTGGANARGEIMEYRFIQDHPVATTGPTWGRLKALYR